MRVANEWAVVLAGGEGERLKAFIERRHGRPMPKQYCAFNGGKTMLEHTMERIKGIIPGERTVTIIGRGHRRFLGDKTLHGRVLEQYANRGTLPGVLLGLAHVIAADPEATVLILPSDHFMEPLAGVRRVLREALETADRAADKLVMLAAVPDGPEPDYGWIEPGVALSGRAFSVRVFHEKPTAEQAAEFFEEGLLWSTMIVAAKARTLWDMARIFSPNIMGRFDLLRVAAGMGRAEAMMPFVYGALKAADFSRDLLERVPHRSLVLPMTDLRWSDWGRPERIEDTLRQAAPPPAPWSDRPVLVPAYA
jgi:mannose-1-phosphate guanylyltransferase